MTNRPQFFDAEVWPEGSLEVLSQFEVDQLKSSGAGGLYPLLRRCMLAVLNSGSRSDDARALLETYSSFEVGFIQQDRGLKVSLKQAPSEAFVDGTMIRGTRELLFAVLRDIVCHIGPDRKPHNLLVHLTLVEEKLSDMLEENGR